MLIFVVNFTLSFIHQLTVVFHFQALVHMKELQDRCIAKEGVISNLRKRNENVMNEQDQYKEALHILNKKVTELKEKLNKEAH